MNNTYSYFYVGKPLSTEVKKNAQEIKMGFFQKAIGEQSNAYLITVKNNTTVSSLIVIEFFKDSDVSEVVTIVNCTRPLKNNNEKKEIAYYRQYFDKYIADFYNVNTPRSLCVTDTVPINTVSQFFRNSNTFTYEKCNTYQTQDVTLHAAELGFVMLYPVERQGYQEIRYNRYLILQALMLTYGKRMQYLTDETIAILKKGKDYVNVIKHREEIATFSILQYFKYPVYAMNHELFALYGLMLKKMHIDKLVEELVENSKVLEEIANMEEEKRKHNMNIGFTILGLIITIVSIPNLLEYIAK